LDSQETDRISARLSHFVQRHILWLLVGCYALSACWPEPGLTLRLWELPRSPGGGVPVSVPLLLLTLLLFCAALMTNLAQIRSVLQRPGMLVAGLVAVWLGPALLVILAGLVVPWLTSGAETAGLLAALALVATMPVANSSVGWAQNAGGNLALALGLVVLSISLSPWTTPHLLGLLGLSLAPAERAICESLVARFSGTFFIVWVILPTLAGLACHYLAGANRIASVRPWIILVSASALLVLNYVNTAMALPKVFNQTPILVLLTTAVLAVALSVVGMALGWAIAWLLRLSVEMRLALLFGLSMKHTGLALVLAGAVLAEQPLAILMIVLATLMQHLLAAIVQWLQQRVGRLGAGIVSDAKPAR
jgi:BASS family bile acid:Na+ symporter